MERKERLWEKLKKELGITTEQELMEAAAEAGVDIGIFIRPIEKEEKSA